MKSLPRVVIVGRTNVGKSTLFNRLSTQVKSLTLDYAGVTRDVLKDEVCWQGRCFELVDTGGISLRKTTDPILEEVRTRALAFMEQAQVVLFVLDGKVGVVAEDQEIAKLLRKMGIPVFVVINKADTNQARERVHEFDRLGFKHTMPISAQHGSGVGDLLDELVKLLPEAVPAEDTERICHVVLLGKPNVGKSSLMNILVKEERSIVAAQPGTTREAISERIAFNQAEIEVTDTAGIRRKRGVTEQLETLMVKSSFRAVQAADIVLLLVDAAQGTLSDQETKLAFYVFQESKALILLFNKQDLVEGFAKEDLERSLEPYDYMLKKVRRLDISCKTGKNVGKILPLVETVWKRYTQRFEDEDLTMLFKQALQNKPLYHKTLLLTIAHAKQVATGPITIILFVNVPRWFGPSQLAFLENLMRDNYDLVGVPIKFMVRKRG